jgi:hypothetical protein
MTNYNNINKITLSSEFAHLIVLKRPKTFICELSNIISINYQEKIVNVCQLQSINHLWNILIIFIHLLSG